MAATTEDILRDLQFSRNKPDTVVRQVLCHLDEKNLIEVMRTLEILACVRWTDAERAFRALVLTSLEDWVAACRKLPVFDQLVTTITTLRVLGEPTPDLSDLVAKAEEILRKRRAI